MTWAARMPADVVMSGCTDASATSSANSLTAEFTIQIAVVICKFHTSFAGNTVLAIFPVRLIPSTVLVDLAG